MREYSPPETVVYQPTVVQKDRYRALRRFNLLYVYLPIVLCSLLILSVIGYFGWQTAVQSDPSALMTASGLADLILIIVMIPMVIIGLIWPAALIGLGYWLYKRRQERKERPSSLEEGVLIQKYTWRAESALDKVLIKVQSVARTIADTVIRMNVWLAGLEARVRTILFENNRR